MRSIFIGAVLSQLQRVMDNPRFLLSGECEPLRAGDQVRIYARRGVTRDEVVAYYDNRIGLKAMLLRLRRTCEH